MKILNKSIFSVTDQLKPTDDSLHTYIGETLSVIGYIDVPVEYESQALILPLIVVKGHGPSLFGRNWLENIKRNWSAIHTVTLSSAFRELITKSSESLS